MMSEFLTLFIYGLVLLVAVIASGLYVQKIALTHTRVQLVMSFVSGLMLGIAIFHLLPHAIYTIDPVADSLHHSVEPVVKWLMIGLLSMFLLLRLCHFHHHDTEEAHPDLNHDCSHNHKAEDNNSGEDASSKSLFGVALGLTLHTMIDGVALAASIQADTLLGTHGSLLSIAGFGVFIAILLHKPLDAMTLLTMMRRTALSRSSQFVLLAVFACLCPIAAAFMLLGFQDAFSNSSYFVGAALAFSTGVFLCIALGDLLPEIHFHSHDRFKMTVVLLLGIALALMVSWVEPDHQHGSLLSPWHYAYNGLMPV